METIVMKTKLENENGVNDFDLQVGQFLKIVALNRTTDEIWLELRRASQENGGM